MKMQLSLAAVACMVLVPLDAQRPGSRRRVSIHPPSPKSRNHDTVKKAFRDVVVRARRSTVRVLADGKQVVLGTIVDADGHIVTKASELPKDTELTCHLPDGRRLPATVLGVHRQNDLAMLKVATKDLVPVAWSKDVGCKPGSWLATPGQGELPISIGVMSAQVHGRLDRRDPNLPFLGVRTDPRRKEVRLQNVIPGTAAEAAGLRRGDVILEFGGHEVESRQHFTSSIRRRKPGEKVKLKILRRGEEMVVEATLRRQDRRGPISTQEPLWGPLSDVRIGFAKVIQHDSVLKPNQCGGPLVNLDGEVVGVNISRVGRMETLALTGKLVRSMLEDLKSGKR